jgi:hypothetical protein
VSGCSWLIGVTDDPFVAGDADAGDVRDAAQEDGKTGRVDP